MNYRHIDYCNLEGESEEGEFIIENFASTPVPGCSYANELYPGYTYSSDDNIYYKKLDGFEECWEEEGYIWDCMDYLEEAPELEVLKDQEGHFIERICELRFDIALGEIILGEDIDDDCGECPQLMPPAPGFCEGGVIIDGGIDDCGCQLPSTCEYKEKKETEKGFWSLIGCFFTKLFGGTC